MILTALSYICIGLTSDNASINKASGEELIEFAAEVEESVTNMNLATIICNPNQREDRASFRVGIALENVTQNGGLALHYFTNILLSENTLVQCNE